MKDGRKITNEERTNHKKKRSANFCPMAPVD